MLIGLVFDLDTIITPPSNLATAPTTKKYTHQKEASKKHTVHQGSYL